MSSKVKNKTGFPTECKRHKPKLAKMSYVSAFEEADRRIAKGQKQKQCPVCYLWFFPDEY
jgi:hypothetical protein